MSNLSREQLDRLVSHLDELNILLLAANNGLIQRLIESETMQEPDRQIVHEWSVVVNEILEKSNAEVTRIKSSHPPKMN